MNFYKHYIGDYQRDTGHLSLAEHGAYRLMLDTFYATGKPLPADKKALYRLLRAATVAERKAIDVVSAQFWEATPAGLVNQRAAVEIVKAEKQAEINRQIAIEREKRKRQRLDETGAPSPCINPGMEEIIGNGALSDPVHESDKVFEVCRVNNTHIVSPTQPLSCTIRNTVRASSVEPDGNPDAGLSREPIHNQSQNQNHNHNQNNEECGNLATRLSGVTVPDVPDGSAPAGVNDVDSEKDGDVFGRTGHEASDARHASVSLAKAMQKAGITAAAGDPRLMALASQGVDVDTVVAACSEAKRARPNERIGMAYIVKIVERWSRDAHSIAARGARAHGRFCVHEERKKALDELTGRFVGDSAPPVSGIPLTLDGSVLEIDGNDS